MVGGVLLEPRGGRAVAGFALAVVLPPALTALALLPTSKGTAVPACLYLLGVAAASVLGGLWPGLLAAALSFAGLDYFFTPPRHTFAVSKGEDLFVLAVFMIVAGAVSATLAALVAQRARAELREYQVRTLAAVMARLLSGEPLETVLLDLATALRTLFQLEGCRVVMGSGEGEQVVGGAGSLATDALSPPAAAHVTAVPLRVDGRPLGRIEMAGTPRGMGPSERQLVETFAGQLALAAERTRLGKEAEASRLASLVLEAVVVGQVREDGVDRCREPRGSGGFGYDPAFVPDDTGPGDDRTMAELDPAGPDAPPPPRPSAFHGRRTGQPARRTRDLSRIDAVSHPRLQRA